MEIFAQAVKSKLRFAYKGALSVEDLWDLSLSELDSLYKALRRQQKTLTEESLLAEQTAEDATLALKVEIVKFVVSDKVAERDAAKEAVVRAQQKRKLLDVLARKQAQALEEMSEEEIRAALEAL